MLKTPTEAVATWVATECPDLSYTVPFVPRDGGNSNKKMEMHNF